MSAKETQEQVRQILATIFDPADVQSEWSVRTNATDRVYDALSYAPRLDLGIGPFNTSRQRRDEDRALIVQRAEHPLMTHLRHAVMQQNDGRFFENRNPRCMLAIELEYSTSSKHILGGITNASLLGYMAVIIGSSISIPKVRRIHEYACRLREVEKAHVDMFANVACFEDAEFLALLRGFTPNQTSS